MVLGILSAFLITFLSPIQLVNEEILARTNPTLLDVFVALVAGGVAAMALTQPRISNSLAGVAIATSLLPPLCVSGIGLALANAEIFGGGLLLFLANVISIIFIAVCYFYFIGVRRTTRLTLRRKGFLFILFVLLITAIPLFSLLRQYSFELSAYNQVQSILSNGLKTISPNITLERVKTEVKQQNGTEVLVVQATLWLPEDFSINFNQRERLVAQLQHELKRDVELTLQLQKQISVVSEQDILYRSKNEELKNTFVEELEKINSALSIDSLQISQRDDDEVWVIDTVLRGDPSTALSIPQLESLEEAVSTQTDTSAQINVEIISRIQLQTNPDIENKRIKSDVEKAMYETFPEITVSNISFQTSVPGNDQEIPVTTIAIEVKTPRPVQFDSENIAAIQNLLEAAYEKEFVITIESIAVNRFRLE